MLYKNLIKRVYKTLNKYYPIKTTDFSNLSHFWLYLHNWNKRLPFKVDINGKILYGENKGKLISKVITKNKEYTWKKYLIKNVSLLNKFYNPCVNPNMFIKFLHLYNRIDDLCITKVIINNKSFDVNYLDYNEVKYYFTKEKSSNYKINKSSNHFYFNSFNVNSNHKQLHKELSRLFKNRDKYKSIHFHLDRNGGGDNVPAHLVLRCLVGKKEKWMKNIRKKLTNKKYSEWDCWKEEDKSSPNYEVVKKLKVKIPNYETKYKGKIYLHMDKCNGSATWYFITYMIYAFANPNNIKRYSKKCCGQTIKFGKINSKQLVLIGKKSGTTSGDGNAILKSYSENIQLQCPTEQFISCSIKKNDWNRFWIGK